MNIPFDGYKVAFIGDVHQEPYKLYHPSYYTAKKFILEWKPDALVILGDWFDFYYMSRFGKDDVEYRRDDALEIDYEKANKELDDFASIPLIIYRQGNHEERLEREIKNETKYRSLLTLNKRLMFKKRGILYTREVDDPQSLGDLDIIHGWYWNKYHARKHLDEHGGNIIYGHVHHHQGERKTIKADKRLIGAWSVPCLTDVNPEYMKGKPTRHSNGFATAYFDRAGHFNMYIIDIIEGGFWYEGKKY